jgi:hypothetical protein
MIENKDLKAKLNNKLKCYKKKENTIENNTTNKNIEIIKEVMKEKNENIISKKNKIKTSTHDVMMIQTSLNNIKTTFTDIKSISLTGDLGYLSSKKTNSKLGEFLLKFTSSLIELFDIGDDLDGTKVSFVFFRFHIAYASSFFTTFWSNLRSSEIQLS